MLCFEFSLFVNYNCCNFDLLYLLGFFFRKSSQVSRHDNNHKK